MTGSTEPEGVDLAADAAAALFAAAGAVVCTDPECITCPGDGSEPTMEPVAAELARLSRAGWLPPEWAAMWESS